MKILLVSYSGYGLWFTLRLLQEGHKVDYYLLDRRFSKVLEGIAPEPFYKKPDFGKYDLVLFDLTGKPKLAEEAAIEAPTLGDSDVADILENDRLFGIRVMEECDIEVPIYETFSDVESAKKYINKNKGRYVFKPNGGQKQDTASTYVSEDYIDLLKYIDRLEDLAHGDEFILQEVVEGTEVSTEAWFNGSEFFFVNCTLEEKKFMEGRKGSNTGCSGNLIFAFNGTPRIFRQGLEKLKPFLIESGYVGMIDLNTIASYGHLYGLEWTPRFGYDASATLFCTLGGNLGNFFYDIAVGNSPNVDIKYSYSAATRISIPPYPSECEGYYRENVPIQGIEPEELEEVYLYDACVNGTNELITAGCGGFICAPIGCGWSIEGAWSAVGQKVKKIRIPDMQYRQDLYKCTKDRYDVLSSQGWFK